MSISAGARRKPQRPRAEDLQAQHTAQAQTADNLEEWGAFEECAPFFDSLENWKPPKLATKWDVCIDLQTEWGCIVWDMDVPLMWECPPTWED